MKNYDTSARPEHSTVASKVRIALTLIHIDLDETKGVLTTNGWLKINWTDSKLSWNPSDYENLASLHVAAGDVWQPDLTIYNSASANLIDHYGKTNAILFNNGQVLWVSSLVRFFKLTLTQLQLYILNIILFILYLLPGTTIKV